MSSITNHPSQTYYRLQVDSKDADLIYPHPSDPSLNLLLFQEECLFRILCPVTLSLPRVIPLDKAS